MHGLSSFGHIPELSTRTGRVARLSARRRHGTHPGYVWEGLNREPRIRAHISKKLHVQWQRTETGGTAFGFLAKPIPSSKPWDPALVAPSWLEASSG